MAVKEISNKLFFTNIRNIINSGNSVELKIKGTSMHPTLLNGEHKVVLTSYQKQFLRVGIILLFVYKEKYILHRLVSINENQLILQGDNQPYRREYIEEKDIVGMVKYIISPRGKITDCEKKRFFIKNRLWRPIQQYYLFFVRKTKGFFIKTLAYI